MPVLSRYVLGAIAVLALGACDPRFVRKSDLSAREIVALSGTWSGRASLTFSTKTDCPRVYLWSLSVASGNVNGTVISGETPDAPPSTFTTFVEYDGSLHATLGTRGRDFALLGSFSHDGFSGTARSPDCIYAVTLSHREGAS